MIYQAYVFEQKKKIIIIVYFVLRIKLIIIKERTYEIKNYLNTYLV